LDGVLINGDFTTSIAYCGFVQLAQQNKYVYIIRMDTDSSGNFFTEKASGTINTLLYL